jgi:hypothetical protein
MQFANYGNGEFLNAAMLVNAEALTQQNFAQIGQMLHTPGVVGAGLSYSIAGLVVTFVLPAPFGVLFGSGVLAQAHGVAVGNDTQIYPVDVSSLVPTGGQQTVYIVATAATIGLDPIQIVGPPVGHPDYDPAFAPYTLYSEIVDTVALAATTTAPDNIATIEVARLALSAGQVSVTGVDTGHQVRAGAVLSQNGEVVTADLAPTGVAPGTYPAATVTVGPDGRLTFAGPSPTAVVPGTYAAATITVASDGRLTFAGPSPTGVTPGSYTSPNLTVESDGRITALASTTPAAPFTLSPTGVAAGYYTAPNLGIDAEGRVVSAVSTTAPPGFVLGNTTVVPGSYVAPNIVVEADGRVTSAVSGWFQSLASPGWTQFPNGLILQWGNVGVSQTVRIIFPKVFPNTCLRAFAGEENAAAATWGAGHPTIYGTGPLDRAGFSVWALNWQYNSWTGAGPIGCAWWAIGF